MAKKSVTIEEPIQDEQVLPTVEEVTVEAVEPTVEPIDWFTNGYPSRDFFTPIPGVTEGRVVAQPAVEEVPVVEEAPVQDGGQEQA